MKTKRTIPTNWSFFNEHGLNYAAYGLIGFIGQVLSGISLLYAVYSLILEKLQGSTSSTTFYVMIIGVAATVALFIELANRKLARPAIKPWVQKDLFTDDPTAKERHEVLTLSYRIILCLVAGVSYLFSGIGSVEYAQDSAPLVSLVSTDSIQQVYQQEQSRVQQAFKADSSLLAPVFVERLTAARERFNSDSLALMKARSKYIKCAERGNEWCQGKLTTYLGNIDVSRRTMADSLATIQREKMIALQAFLKKRDKDSHNLQAEKRLALEKAEVQNTDLRTTSKSNASLKGYIFILLTLVGQTIFYLMVYLQLQIEAGSGIEHEIEPNEFWDKPGLGEEVQATLGWRIERGLRRVIAAIFSEPDAEKQTDIPYWKLVKQTNDSTAEAEEMVPDEADEVENKSEFLRKSEPNSCSVKDTLPFDQELADAKSKLSIYKKRLGSHKQKAIVQQRQKGTVLKRTQNAIENNERWVQHWTAEVKRLAAKSTTHNGQEIAH